MSKHRKQKRDEQYYRDTYYNFDDFDRPSSPQIPLPAALTWWEKWERDHKYSDNELQEAGIIQDAPQDVAPQLVNFGKANYYASLYVPEVYIPRDYANPVATVLMSRGSWDAEIGRILHDLKANVIYTNSLEDVLEGYAKASHVLIPGGSDIDPSHYGELNSYSRPYSPERDALEFALVEQTLKDGKPLLGICRGHQLINVVAGGTLFQDIELDAGVVHNEPSHKANLYKPSRRIGQLTGKKSTVNSYHHQAVHKVAPGWRIGLLSDDGIIESIEHPSLPVLSVQFHPEVLAGGRKYFQAFIGLQKKGKGK